MQQIHFPEVAKYPSRESGNACKEEMPRGVHPKRNIVLFTIELLKDMEESSLYEKVVVYAERRVSNFI